MHPRFVEDQGEDNMFPSGAGINLGEREATLSWLLTVAWITLATTWESCPLVQGQKERQREGENKSKRKEEMSTRGRSFDQTPKTYAV